MKKNDWINLIMVLFVAIGAAFLLKTVGEDSPWQLPILGIACLSMFIIPTIPDPY